MRRVIKRRRRRSRPVRPSDLRFFQFPTPLSNPGRVISTSATRSKAEMIEVTLPEPLGGRTADEARGLRCGFSLFDLYARHGAKPAYLDQTFEAQVADRVLAKRLGIRSGQAVFLTTSITYRKDGRPRDLRRATYRADRYKFSLRRRAD